MSGTIDTPRVERLWGLAPSSLAPLAFPTFRIAWASRLADLTGGTVQLLVLAVLALGLTGRASGWGGVLMAQTCLSGILLVVGGLVTDHFRPRSVLITAAAVQAVSVAALALMVTAGAITYVYLLVFALAYGVAQGISLPASFSLVPEALPTAQVRAGTALFAATENVVRFLAPPVGGLLVAAMGPGSALVAVAVLYAVQAVLLSQQRAAVGAQALPEAVPDKRSSPLDRLRAGVRAARADDVIWLTLGQTALFWFGWSAAFYLGLPALAQLTFGGGEVGIGALTGSVGAGALAGVLMVGPLGRLQRPGIVGGVAGLVVGVALVAAGLAPTLLVAAALLLLVGACQAIRYVIFLSLVQARAAPAVRGRVVSLLLLAAVGPFPFAFAAASAVADLLGPRFVMVIAGSLAALAGIFGIGAGPIRALR